MDSTANGSQAGTAEPVAVEKRWILRLYVAGETPRSLTAIDNLKEICETYIKNEYEIEVIDLRQKPQLAAGDQILAIPTLIRKLPAPMKKIIGDLSDTERVLIGLDIRPIHGGKIGALAQDRAD